VDELLVHELLNLEPKRRIRLDGTQYTAPVRMSNDTGLPLDDLMDITEKESRRKTPKLRQSDERIMNLDIPLGREGNLPRTEDR